MDAQNRQMILQYWQTQLPAWLPGAVHFAGLAPASAGPFVQPWRALELVVSGLHPVGVWRHGDYQRLAVRPGECLYLPSGCGRHMIWDSPALILGIVIRDTHLRFLVGELTGDGVWPTRPTWQYHTSGPPATAILDLARGLDELAAQDEADTATAPLMAALCHLCVKELDQDMPQHLGKAHHTWQAICAYIDERIGAPLSRDQVAQDMEVNPAYLSRLFRQQAGEGFHAYLTRMRLEHASRLLRDSRLLVKEVASQIGFADVRYFIHVFRTHFGLPPGRYRQQFRGPDRRTSATERPAGD